MFRLTVALLITLCVLRPAYCVTHDEITIFFTGNELGQLKPCGCSGGQLGGLDRRYAILNAVPPEKRLIFDTGSLVPELTEQNLIKFNIVVQAFGQLGYDVVNLTQQDILIARQTGLFDGLSQLFNCITAQTADDTNLPARFTKHFSLNDKVLIVTVGVANTDEQLSSLEKIFSPPAGQSGRAIPVNILIINRSDPGTIAAVSKSQLVHCLMVPSQSDEPTLMNDPNSRPLVISVGRIGKYVGKVKAGLQSQSDKPRLSFSAEPVTEDLNQYGPLVELYKDYQRMVKEAGLVEKYPRFVLPDYLEYVGSKSCKLCHDYEYEKWQNSQTVNIPGRNVPADDIHSKAYASLEKVGSDYDPECVICHVVGMQYQSGFITPAKTPEMKDVGCENCHGPGSEHVRSLGANETSGPISTCTDCHTVEQSADYQAHKDEYYQKIIHWRTPVSRIRVGEPNKSPQIDTRH